MLDFAIAAHARPADLLSRTITSITAVYPQSRVLIGLDAADAALCAVLDHSHPDVIQVRAEEVGGGVRAALAAAASSRYVLFLEPGAEIASSTVLAEALRALRETAAPILFASVHRVREKVADGDPLPAPEPVFRVASDADGEVTYTSVDVLQGDDTTMAADVGPDVFILDRSQVGASHSVDWDPEIGVTFETRDLFMAIARTPGLQARYFPSLALEVVNATTAASTPSMERGLAAFLRKWSIHTERFEPDDIRDYAAAGPYRGLGVRTNVRPSLRKIVRTQWRHPSRLTTSLAALLSAADFNQYVVCRSGDLLANNIFIARDRSWLYVDAAHSASETVLAMLAGSETGLPPRLLDRGNHRDAITRDLVRPGDIGLAATAELLDSPDTLKFMFTADPFARLIAAYHHCYVQHPGTDVAAEALRSRHGHRHASASAPHGFGFSGFLAEIDGQPEHLRPRRWRTLTTALAWGRVQYDFVGRAETLSDDLQTVNSMLAERQRPTLPEVSTPATARPRDDQRVVLTADDVVAIQTIYRADFENFGYSTDPPDQRGHDS